MLKRYLIPTAAIVLTLGLVGPALVSPALAAPQDYVGTWVNKNPNTRSITRFVVKKTAANKMSVQVFGKCSPSDCNWGQADFFTYGTSVQDASGSYGMAMFNPGFAQNILTFNRTNKEVMVEDFTRFTDNSGRQNYYDREYFKRQ